MKSTKVRKASQFAPDIGHRKADLHLVEVDNPAHDSAASESPSNPRKSSAYLNLGESPVNLMYLKGHLEFHHVRAASDFRKYWETMGGAGVGSFDYAREMVDCGASQDGFSDSKVYASKMLRQASEHIGKRAYEIVRKVAAEGCTITQISATKREKTTNADYLRDGLEDLAELWGYKQKGKMNDSAAR